MKQFSLISAVAKHVVIAIAFLAMFGFPAQSLANTKAEQLQRKTADIELLHQQLMERNQQALSLLSQIETQKKELIAEIRLLSRSFKFASYAEARHNRRIYYNVELLRPLMAYIGAFESKIRFYQAGHDRLTYMRQLVQDDIKLTAALNDYEIDALTTQISLVINKYMNDAHIIRIDPQPDVLLTAKEVWDRIKIGKN